MTEINAAAAAAAAAKRAAEIAQRLAAKRAQAAAAQKAAEQKAQDAAAKEVKEPPRADRDQAEGLLGRVVEGARSFGQAVAEAHGQKVEATQQERRAIARGLEEARTPAEVEALAGRAEQLAASVEGDAELEAKVAPLARRAESARQAVQLIEETQQGLKGTPEARAEATARVLSQAGALEGLRGLEGSPYAGKAVKAVEAIAKQATPERLAAALTENPDLTAYPPEMAAHLTSLRQAGDPALDAAIDGAAGALLDQPGGLSVEAVRENPALGQLVATSSDPAIRAKAAEAAQGWAKASLDRHLEGKEGEDEAKQAVEDFKQEMTDLARETGLGQLVGQGAEAAAQEGQGRIEEVTKDGGGILGGIKNAIGDVAGFVGDIAGDVASVAVDVGGAALKPVSGAIEGATGGVASLMRKGVGLAASGLDAGLGGLGKVADVGLDALGKVNPVTLGSRALAGGLDAVGLDGAADKVGAVGDFVENAYDKAGDGIAVATDKVGDQVENFTRGAGDALAGTVQGLGQMAAHPLDTAKGLVFLATHPGQIKEVGKAMWAEASKHGTAGAIGYVAGMVAPMLLTGGASGAATGAGKLAGSSNAALRLAGTGMNKVGATVGQTRVAGMVDDLTTKGAAVAKAAANEGSVPNVVRAIVKPAAQLRDEARMVENAGLTEVVQSAKAAKGTLGGRLKEGVEDLGKVAKVEPKRVSLQEGGDVVTVAGDEALKKMPTMREILGNSELDRTAKGLQTADRLEAAMASTRFQYVEKGIKTAANVKKALDDPFTLLEDRVDRVVSRLLRSRDAEKALKAGEVAEEGAKRLRSEWQVATSVGDAAIKQANAQASQTEEFQAIQDEVNTVVREQVLSRVGL